VQTEIVVAGESATRRAVELLSAGEVVALPTETVYGLAADALNPNAVARIFEAKERPRFDPLIVHLPARSWLERIASTREPESRIAAALADRFWPGPLTIVLPRQAAIPDLVTAGLETVAVRMSSHPVFIEVARVFGKPLAAPSANRFGRISPTRAIDVAEELSGRIPLIVDAGPTIHGLESTIVAPRRGAIEILRPGPITLDQLSEFGEVRTPAARSAPEAPGQFPSHYAPSTAVELVKDLSTYVPEIGKRVGALSLRGNENDLFAVSAALSRSGELIEAAANLYRSLRELDGAGLDLIVAEHVPEEGIGVAIMDRLRRAATRS
jgi:L-threonylcarbamoyladenylate synthase